VSGLCLKAGGNRGGSLERGPNEAFTLKKCLRNGKTKECLKKCLRNGKNHSLNNFQTETTPQRASLVFTHEIILHINVSMQIKKYIPSLRLASHCVSWNSN
jgi:hypothetical protein